MKRYLPLLFAATCLAAVPAAAQIAGAAPEIAYDSAANPLSLPGDIYLGESAGVATNSRGDIFVYTRTGHPTEIVQWTGSYRRTILCGGILGWPLWKSDTQRD